MIRKAALSGVKRFPRDKRGTRLRGVPKQMKSAADCSAADCIEKGFDDQVLVMSTSLVSGRKMKPMTRLISAITTGYHRPE